MIMPKMPDKNGKQSLNLNVLSIQHSNSLVNMSQEEVAKEFNVSRQYIQQLEKRALQKFKIRFCALYPDTWKLIRDDIGRGHF